MNFEEQNKDLIKALKFYANLDHYIFNKDGRGVSLPDDEGTSVVVEDLGNVAIAALVKVLKPKE